MLIFLKILGGGNPGHPSLNETLYLYVEAESRPPPKLMAAEVSDYCCHPGIDPLL